MPPGSTVTLTVSGTIAGETTFGVTSLLEIVPAGGTTGPRGGVWAGSVTNPGLAQIERATNRDQYGTQVYVLPKLLDEKGARLHLDKLDAHLTELSDEQAAYIGVDKSGPYKPEMYRY